MKVFKMFFPKCINFFSFTVAAMLDDDDGYDSDNDNDNNDDDGHDGDDDDDNLLTPLPPLVFSKRFQDPLQIHYKVLHIAVLCPRLLMLDIMIGRTWQPRASV